MRRTGNLICVFIASGLVFGCSLTRNHKTNYYYASHDFSYIQTSDTIILKLTRFYKNDAYCYTSGIPYALLIGESIRTLGISDTLSILAHCDNNTYEIGDILRIVQIENPELRTSMHKISIVKDTLINGIKTKWTIGSEYPGIWGRVIQ